MASSLVGWLIDSLVAVLCRNDWLYQAVAISQC
jgi:hypothetical protein